MMDPPMEPPWYECDQKAAGHFDSTPERIRLALRLLEAAENGAGFWSDPDGGISSNGGLVIGKRRIGTWYSNYSLDAALKAAGY